MKKLLFTLALYAIVVLITACGGNKTQDDHPGTHTHADGTVHEEGDHAEEIKDQESFVVDSTDSDDHSGAHTHADGIVHEGETHDHEAAAEESDEHDHDHQH